MDTIRSQSNIEDGSVRISLRMLWAFAVALVVGSLSLAGLFFNVQGSIAQLSKTVESNKVVQDIQIENVKLNATRTEIDLKDLKRQMDLKEDKKK